MKSNLKFYNLQEDDYRLYEICKEEGWTDCDDYEEWSESGASWSIFEGDPDFIKLDGDTVYFWRYGDEIFYDCDYFDSHKVRGILRDFYDGAEFRRYGYYAWWQPRRISPDWLNSWDDFNRLTSGIAYRGGCGYTYALYPLRNAA